VLVRDSRRVHVSGAPGSGKTSLAILLAAELGYALLAKDRIKGTLHD
jgi:adenylate kinase family enzyme